MYERPARHSKRRSNFCSLECALKATSKHYQEKKKNKKIVRTVLNKIIRKSDRMDQWKKDVLRRDNYTCQISGVKGGDLEVHHIVPFSQIMRKHNITSLDEALACAELWDLDNGIAVSPKCHHAIHIYTDIYLSWFEGIQEEEHVV